MNNLERERKRFEAWAIRQPRGFDMRHGRRSAKRPDYRSPITQAAWEAWQARCPEGWQVVPKRMDRGMMSAAIPNNECNFPNFGPQEHEVQVRYVRALAAAPQPVEGS